MIADDTGVHRDTHAVTNQPPPLADYNLFTSDRALMDGLSRAGGDWALTRASAFGAQLGGADFIEHGFLANRHTPELKTHDRYGRRIDEVRFHPSWHAIMAAGVAAEVHALPWNHPRPGAHGARAALHFMLSQIEAGAGCPLTMTFAAVPTLRAEPPVAAAWLPRMGSTHYDPRNLPGPKKHGGLIGMAMTEKQGGSDVRTNTTRAEACGSDGAYLLTGHKWFCSAPMCDAFLTLAQTEDGLTCFLAPRWTPDGERNRIFIQRLKDKLGNRSNASSEIEYDGAYAQRIGEPGRGVRTIIEMVSHTRLDCVIGSAGLMRQALAQALHHTAHRAAFGALLIEQPLMRAVLADLALESEAATALMFRLAQAYDASESDEGARAFARIATAIGKYWVCKRAPAMIFECMECHGGNGYVEESVLPRLYREAPVNSIWEGSGNVMCLDVVRALERTPASGEVLFAELAAARGVHSAYDGHFEETWRAVSAGVEARQARYVVEALAKALQCAVLIRSENDAAATAYCAARIACRGEYGACAGRIDEAALIERAMPEA